MARIIVDSSDLQAIAADIEANCTALGYITDEDDIEDVWYYAERIKTQLFLLSRVIDEAAPEKGG